MQGTAMSADNQATATPRPSDRDLIMEIIHDLDRRVFQSARSGNPQSRVPERQQVAALRRLLARADDYLGWQAQDALDNVTPSAQVKAPLGFVPTASERGLLGRIHDGAPPLHIGDLTRRLVKRILAVACPVQSNECAIQGMCTNKCGALDRDEVNPTTGTWICPK
jgi:hypothetical protein